MQHEPDVRFIDAHPERVGCDDHACVVGQKAALGCGARLAVETGVVGERRLAERGGQLLGDLLGSGARARVDDRRLSLRPGPGYPSELAEKIGF